MVAVRNVPASDQVTSDLETIMLDGVNELLEIGDSLGDACEVIAERIARAGRGEEAWRLLGKEAVHRFVSMHGNLLKANLKRASGEVTGVRRMGSGLLHPTALLETQICVAPKLWMRLGDLGKAECQAKANAYFRLAADNTARGEVFVQIAARLSEGQKVRDCFDQETLLALFQGAAPD